MMSESEFVTDNLFFKERKKERKQKLSYMYSYPRRWEPKTKTRGRAGWLVESGNGCL